MGGFASSSAHHQRLIGQFILVSYCKNEEVPHSWPAEIYHFAAQQQSR